MKKYLLFLLLINLSFAYSFENVSIPAENGGYSSNMVEESAITGEEISILEKKIFKNTFGKDSVKTRLSRLEKEIFGMEQKGNDEDRFENLITAADYYDSGYRQSQTQAKAKSRVTSGKDEYKINPRDYITNYNFEEDNYDDLSQKYSMNKDSYYERGDYVLPENNKKQSKIVQFFAGIVDALTSGVVTGYTLPMNNFGYDPFDDFTNFGGTNFAGIPQFPAYVPQINNYISPYRYNRRRYPYITRHNHYNPPPPGYNYNRLPYGNGIGNYKSGAGVKIIH